ncbi:MAG TPA: pH regulation protein F, partial [Aliiroseovarius sp.]|nr:pH regulation protein F [Aliiroseovarius sp.]
MFAIAAIAILIAMALTLVRLFSGPTLYDRVLAVNA